MPLIDLLARNAREHGNSTFLVVENRVYSFQEIHDAALRFASLLQTIGAQQGQHIALIAENSAAYIIAWFGISAAGCVAVTLNTQSMGEGLRHSLSHSDATIIVADAAWCQVRLVRGTALAQLPRVEIHSDAELLDLLSQYERAEALAVSDG